MIPKRLESVRRQLLAHAARTPHLASAYEARAAVFAHRISAFEPDAVIRLGERRRGVPALARYWRALQARPSFVAADIWTKLHVGGLIGGIVGFGRG